MSEERQKELEEKAKEALTTKEEELLKDKHVIPSYLTDIYNWAYVKPKNIDRLDKLYVYHTILFGQGWKLMNAYLEEIQEGTRMLQVAHVYGNILNKVADKIGEKGSLDIIDVVPYQIERARKKVGHLKYVNMWVQDGSSIHLKDYDTVGIYFLLHEVPDDVKTKIINNALDVIDATDGKLIFIDYHNPAFFNPVRPILKIVNTFLEPFAPILWEKEIKDFTTKADNFNWEKKTIFFGAYQKVVVTKKKEISSETQKVTSEAQKVFLEAQKVFLETQKIFSETHKAPSETHKAPSEVQEVSSEAQKNPSEDQKVS